MAKKGELRLELSILGVFLGIFAIFFIGNPQVFSRFDIYYSFMSTIPFSGIMALAITFVIIAGEIDLSFPSILGFSAWVFSKIVAVTEGNIWLATISCLATGVIAGYLNSFIVVKVGIPSLVATIGTQFFFRGLVNVAGQGAGITLIPVKDTFLFNIFVGRLKGAVPAQAIWMVVLAVIFWFILNRHKFGSHVLFVGDNVESARMMGIRVNRIKMIVFMQMGFFSALSGILSSLEVTYFWPTLGQGYLLQTLSAVFVGGTSVFGGMGTIFGTFIGVLIIGSLEAGIIAIGLTGFWTQLFNGLIIVVSLSIYTLLRKRK
jgi:simple sugar transport system permease protein